MKFSIFKDIDKEFYANIFNLKKMVQKNVLTWKIFLTELLVFH